ncbi:unnamed protein product [Nezara viridula]|uniref:Uncharacterized protein n=1 Tax=Nezara viridula TaxID=85310 RepID=A0A9P0HK46_NEZVI|nr:unnamed protein product [Nezara viridula]
MTSNSLRIPHGHTNSNGTESRQQARFSPKRIYYPQNQKVRLECRSDKSTLSVESSGSNLGRHFEGSTPTWTEGTPSFTESSSSGDIDAALKIIPQKEI